MQLKDVQRKMRKIQAHRRAITQLRELAQRDVPRVHNTIASQGDSTLCRRVRYSHKYGVVGRRYCEEGGSQGMSRSTKVNSFASRNARLRT